MKAPGSIAQSVTSPIADPGVMSSIPALSEIDHENFSTVIFLLSLIQKDWC